jgi:AraC-like DNA-binding protein
MSNVRHLVYKPPESLRRYVREILSISSQCARVQILLPEPNLTMMLRQSGSATLNNATLPGALISGLQSHSRSVEHAAGSSILVVRFTEIGGPAILHDRVDLLYNQTVSLDAVLPRKRIEYVQNTLADSREMRQRVAAVESFLAGRIYAQNGASRRTVSPQIEAAARMIRETHGRHSIATVAGRTAMSLSALERQFRAAVGTSPKKFSRLVRLQHVCRLRDTGMTLTQIAIEAGYTDQPHLVRDFHLFTGKSAEQYFGTASPRNLPTFYK